MANSTAKGALSARMAKITMANGSTTQCAGLEFMNIKMAANMKVR